MSTQQIRRLREWIIQRWKRILLASAIASAIVLSTTLLWYYGLLSEFWRGLISYTDLIMWVVYMVFEYWKGKSPLTQEQLRQELKRSIEDTDRLSRLNQHKKDIRGIYEKWATSYLTRIGLNMHIEMPPLPYMWGDISLLEVSVQKSPKGEQYYEEARKDLQCWPETYEKLEHAESLIQQLNIDTKNVREKALNAIRELMEQYDLKEWYNGGGAQEGKGSYDQSILESLILRPISEGKKYVKSVVDLRMDWICVSNPTTKISEKGLVSGVKLGDEAKLIQLFSNFETALGQVMKEPTYFTNLCVQIRKIQSDFSTAQEAYESFKSDLARTAIKDIPFLRFPNGGKCHICLSLRA